MEARRTRILSAAAGLLADGGPESLSMRRLADAADVSVNTIYNLIGPRDAVIAALVDRVIAAIEPAVELASGDEPLSRCVAIIDRSASLVIENQALTRPLAMEIFGHGGPGSEISHGWGTETLGRAIEAAMAAGDLSRSVASSTLAEMVYAVWAHSALRWAHGAIDSEEFLVSSLSSLYMALLTVSTDTSEPALRQGLADTSFRLDRSISARRAAPTPKSA